MTDLTCGEVLSILQEAECFNRSFKDWQLPQKNMLVANLFFEPSTRTHFSFVSAQQQLGMQVTSFHAEGSSVEKGESLYDTVKTFEALGYDVLVIRHPKEGYFNDLNTVEIPIINGGDGSGNHPTQCLLDLYTMYQEFGTLQDLKVLIVGDILHSRVAKSNKEALESFGSEVKFAGPQNWQLSQENTVDLDEGIRWADVVMLLRVQKERGAKLEEVSNGKSYLEAYGLTKARYNAMRPEAILMHPAPVNRGVEIDTDLVEAPKSRIFKQMSNGVLVRKAIMKRALGFELFKL